MEVCVSQTPGLVKDVETQYFACPLGHSGMEYRRHIADLHIGDANFASPLGHSGMEYRGHIGNLHIGDAKYCVSTVTRTTMEGTRRNAIFCVSVRIIERHIGDLHVDLETQNIASTLNRTTIADLPLR